MNGRESSSKAKDKWNESNVKAFYVKGSVSCPCLQCWLVRVPTSQPVSSGSWKILCFIIVSTQSGSWPPLEGGAAERNLKPIFRLIKSRRRKKDLVGLTSKRLLIVGIKFPSILFCSHGSTGNGIKKSGASLGKIPAWKETVVSGCSKLSMTAASSVLGRITSVSFLIWSQGHSWH